MLLGSKINFNLNESHSKTIVQVPIFVANLPAEFLMIVRGFVLTRITETRPVVTTTVSKGRIIHSQKSVHSIHGVAEFGSQFLQALQQVLVPVFLFTPVFSTQ